jgi:hypothetical protein
MTIRVAPFTVGPKCNCISTFGHEKKEHIRQDHVPVTYWGVYVDDKPISYTSNKQLAENTKLWIEKWLRGRF